MRRGSDLAISPPPEFKDNGSTTSTTFVASNSSLVVPLPPPPKDFRDLTPSPGGYTDPILTFGLTPHTLPPVQSYHNGRTFVRKTIWDFADRVSFNIVHEAVVIAVVLPEAGSNISDFRAGGTKQGSIITGSSKLDVLSSSWEHIPSSRCLPIKNYVKSKAQSETPSNTMKNITSLKHTPSFRHSEDVEDIHFVIVKHEPPLPSKTKETVNTSLIDGEKKIPLAESLPCQPFVSDPCSFKVPFQCDIYSVPVDSLPQSSQSTNHRNRTRDQKTKDPSKRNSIQLMGKREPNPEAQSTGFPKLRSNSAERSQREIVSAENHEFKFKTRERNNNSENIRLDNAELKQSNLRSIVKKCVPGDSSQNSDGDDLDEVKNNKELLVKEKKKISVNFLKLFRRNRHHQEDLQKHSTVLQCSNQNEIKSNRSSIPVECRLVNSRALPSPPIPERISNLAIGFQRVQRKAKIPPPEDDEVVPGDFSVSLEKVKDCGWYWGPLSSEGAEDLLRGEPDGSFIVRDSSDARYIFSLTFKLNGLIRHVRIEHDQGNFSFGPLTRFKASTIVDFVEKAVAHSRSGRFLFFLHRRPVLGPMRVQLLHPYSRFRHPRSLQHMCRFVILKSVRRDLVENLGLPKLLLDYLNAPQYYFENWDGKVT